MEQKRAKNKDHCKSIAIAKTTNKKAYDKTPIQKRKNHQKQKEPLAQRQEAPKQLLLLKRCYILIDLCVLRPELFINIELPIIGVQRVIQLQSHRHTKIKILCPINQITLN